MMKYSELDSAWKNLKIDSVEPSKIEGFLHHAVKQRRKKFNLLLKYDYIFSLIISVLFIAISFYFSFRYKWVAGIAMLMFTGILFLHYRFIERVESVEIVRGGLVQIMKHQLGRFRWFRIMYEATIPLFTGLLAFLFTNHYSDLQPLSCLLLCLPAMLIAWITVRLIWKMVYSRQTAQAENLLRLIERLSK